MTITTLSLSLFVALVLLCLAYWAWRMAPPILASIKGLGRDSNSMHERVFPVLAFVGVLGILLKLTLF